MTNHNTLKSLWASQTPSMEPLTPDELRKQARKFRGQIARRNIIEYVAAALVIAVFGAFCVFFPDTPSRIGAGLIIAGTLYVVWSLHKRAGAEPQSSADAASCVLAFHRIQLEKQRDALSSVWSWYILPLLPGMLVFIIGTAPEFANRSSFADGVVGSIQVTYPKLLFVALISLAVWWINKVAARRIDLEIKSIDDLS